MAARAPVVIEPTPARRTLADPAARREFLATLDRLHRIAPAPDPTRIAEVYLDGTYSGPEPAEFTGTAVKARYVPTERVPAKHRRFAQRHADAAAEMLGMASVTIEWFEHCGDGEADFAMITNAPDQVTGGACFSERPGTIALNVGVRGDALVGVIAHEVRHSQQQALLARLGQYQYRELDADMFARLYAQRAIGKPR